jgi:uncharacterized radical SAM superfamily protein
MGRIKKIYFTDLSANQTLSVTGSGCALSCNHCNKKFLKSMSGLNNEIKPGIKSILISGGCDKEGKVPLLGFAKEIKKLKNKYKINAHVGLVNRQEAKKIARLVDVVSFDFVTELKIIKKIYHLNKNLNDYYESLAELQKEISVFPHLTLGLWQGKISWEYHAIELLIKKFNFQNIVFNVFIPAPGTELEQQKPPSIKSIEKYFYYLEKNYPKLDKRLGCMRPGGKYRDELDKMAVLTEFKVITRPSRQAVKLAKNLGYQIFWQDQCCVFI